MARLGWSLGTNFLPSRLSAPRVNSRFPLAQQTHWRYLCAAKAELSDFSSPKELKDVTVVDSTRGAVRAVQTLLELSLDRRVAWNTQLYKPSGKAAASSAHILSASAYAGDDVDFGNGPHLFVAGSASNSDAEIWNLLRRYFQTGECRKVWFDYSASMQAMALKEVRPSGLSGDIVHMTRLYWDKTRKMDIDTVAKATLTKPNRLKAYELWEKNGLPGDQVSTRLWETKGTLDESGITPQWIARACYDASLTYRLDERLRKMLLRTPVHGDAYNTLNGTSAMHRNEDIFNLLQAYEIFIQPAVKAFYAIECDGVPVDFSLLQEVAEEDEHRKRLLEDEFRRWASTVATDALYMDLGSPKQLRQLLFAPCENVHNKKKSLGPEGSFKVSSSKRNEMSGTQDTRKGGEIVLKGVGIKAVSHTKQGWPSTSISALREALEEYTSNPPRKASPGFPGAMESLLESMELGRKVTWYTNQINQDSIADHDGRVRMRYKTDFYTGRLVNSANGKDWEARMLQSISPSIGNDLIHIQYPHLELWTLAQLSGCTSLRGRLSSENSPDTLLAYELFLRSKAEGHSASLSEVSQEQCHAASMLDIAMRKGGEVNVVERLVGCTREDAVYMMKTWYDLHPGVLKWRKGREAFINEHGIAETYMGRRRKMRRGREAEGIGFIVNGTAAEIVMGGVVALRRDERISAIGWHVVHADRDLIVMEGPAWSTEALSDFLEEVVHKPTGFELDIPPQVIMYQTEGEEEDEVARSTAKD